MRIRGQRITALDAVGGVLFGLILVFFVLVLIFGIIACVVAIGQALR